MESSYLDIEVVNPESDDCDISLKGGQIVLIIGSRGSGKSVHGFKLIEEFHSKKPCDKVYVLGVPRGKQRLLPNWITIIDKVEDIPNNAILLVDEAGIIYQASRKRDNLLIYMLQICRHRNLRMLFCNLNSSNVDLQVIRSVDVLAIHQPSLLQSALERRGVGRLVKKAHEEFQKIPYAERIKYSYVVGDKCEGMVKVDLPSFWSDSLSVSWAEEAKPNPAPFLLPNLYIMSITYACPPSKTSTGLCSDPTHAKAQQRFKHSFKVNKPTLTKGMIKGKVKMTKMGIDDARGSSRGRAKSCSREHVIGRLESIETSDGKRHVFPPSTFLLTDIKGRHLCIQKPNPLTPTPNSVLYLYSSKCPTCNKYMPEMEKLKKKYESLIDFKMINLDLKEFADIEKDIKAKPTVILVKSGKAMRRFNGIPKSGTLGIEREIEAVYHPFISA